NLGTATSVALSGSSLGLLNVTEVVINTTGQALSLTTGTLSGGFTSVTSSGGANNVALSGVASSGGAASLGSGALSSPASGPALLISGQDGSFTYSGSISRATGVAAEVASKTGGTVTLSGAHKNISTGLGAGVELSANTGATVDITGGGLVVNTTGAVAGYVATGGGTVSVKGTGNTLSTTTSRALQVSNTTISASGLTFQSISSNGAVNGISLDNTGATGGLSVTGTGTAASGGTIQNSTADGVRLNLVSGVALNRVDVKASGDNGLTGTQVTDLTLNSDRLQNNANSLGEAGLLLTDLRGSLNSVSNTEVSGSFEDNVRVVNSSGTLDALNISGAGCLIKNNSTGSGNVGINIQANGAAVMNGVVVSGCTFSGNRTIAVRADAADTAHLTVTINSNVITAGTAPANQGNQGIEATAASTALNIFDIENNKVGTDGATNAPLGSTGIDVFAGNTSTMSGKVANNTVYNAGAGVSGFGIRVAESSNSAINTLVTGNTVSNVGLDYGIYADAGSGSGAGGTLNVGVTSNNVSVLAGASDASRVQSRTVNTVCARVSSNTTNAGGAGFFGLYGNQANTSTFELEGLTGGTQSAANAQASLQSQNASAASVGAAASTSFTGVSANFCAAIPT